MTAAVHYCYGSRVMVSVLQQQGIANTSLKCLLHPKVVVGSHLSTEPGQEVTVGGASGATKSATLLHSAGA